MEIKYKGYSWTPVTSEISVPQDPPLEPIVVATRFTEEAFKKYVDLAENGEYPVADY